MPSNLTANDYEIKRNYPLPEKLATAMIDVESLADSARFDDNGFCPVALSEICLQHFKIHSRTSKGLMTLS
jgi:hypothetical protein